MIIAAALLGAIAGSFLNALSFRLGTGRSVYRGRSRCMRCGHTLGALDLIPVFSYLFLNGRCRYCRSKVSMQYPLIEMSAAGLSAATYLATPSLWEFGFFFLMWMTLLFVAVYDLKHFIIPWGASGLLAALALMHLLLSHAGPWAYAAGPLLAAPLFLLSLVSGGRWMGWGDSALELGIGWMLGFSAGFSGFLIAFWSGAIVGIILTLLRKGYTMKSELPFAPFLILGAGVAYFFHVTLFIPEALPF